MYIFKECVDMYIERVCIFRESVDIYYIFRESVDIERACLYLESVYIWRESVYIKRVRMYGWRLSLSHTQTRTLSLSQYAECVYMKSVYILKECVCMEEMRIYFIFKYFLKDSVYMDGVCGYVCIWRECVQGER